MWGHVRVEALLSARTVYGDRKDVEHLRKEGLQMLLEARDRYDYIAEAVAIVKSCVSRAQTVEVSVRYIVHAPHSLMPICVIPFRRFTVLRLSRLSSYTSGRSQGDP